MTEWTESDYKWSKYELDGEIGMEAIYGVECPECGKETTSVEFDPDADGPSWVEECRECDLWITLYPVKLSARASSKEL